MLPAESRFRSKSSIVKELVMVPSSIPFLSGRREGENKRAFLSLVLKEGKQGLGAGEGLCHASADQHIQIGDTHVPHIQHSDPAVFFIAFSRTQPNM